MATNTSPAETTAPCCHSLFPCPSSSPVIVVSVSLPTYWDTRRPLRLSFRKSRLHNYHISLLFFVALSRAAIYFDVPILQRPRGTSRAKYSSNAYVAADKLYIDSDADVGSSCFITLFRRTILAKKKPLIAILRLRKVATTGSSFGIIIRFYACSNSISTFETSDYDDASNTEF